MEITLPLKEKHQGVLKSLLGKHYPPIFRIQPERLELLKKVQHSSPTVGYLRSREGLARGRPTDVKIR